MVLHTQKTAILQCYTAHTKFRENRPNVEVKMRRVGRWGEFGHIASVGASRAYLSFPLLVEKVNHDKKMSA